MRLCVSCVYWTLLLVSVVSSCLLFLIVASESTHTSNKPRGISQEESIQLENVVKEVNDARSESVDNKIPDVRARPTVKTEKQHLHPVESDGGPSGHSTSKKESKSEHNLNVLKQSLTPQPNFSQGISETGQAVVLTLVDTAAAELQSLAEPRLSSDIRSRSLPKNVTLRTTTTTTGPIPATTTTTTLNSLKHEQSTEQTAKTSSGPPPVVPLATETPSNATKTLSALQDEAASTQAAAREGNDSKDEVVVVRAEQKSPDETAHRKPEETQEDETKDETPKPDENLTPAPELDDGAARAKLVGGSSDESAAVILDGLVASGSTDHHHEDIPSFSEWAQKRLEEAEKKKTHPNASIQNPGGPGRGLGGMKMRSKNYASPDCGAKIVAVNPEARSARSVLVSTRDEYMLNPCTSRVWFVVELCEAIQAKKIELANFELFSSSPKDFSVHVSDRFPTREWSPVGQFAAKDQRDIQSFSLSPQLFGKFIKVELHSHYGSEHFCPISLFRAYGTSEFEVLETETDHQESEEDENNEDEDEDEALDSEAGAETRNLFGSARDVVIRIVKKAAEVLVKTGDPSNNNITKIQESIEGSITGNSFATCMTPRYTINCANCTDDRFAAVFELLNCRARHLDNILRNAFVNASLRTGEVCSSYGFDGAKLPDSKYNFSNSTREGINVETAKRTFSPARHAPLNFLVSIYSPEYILALCNVIATKERRFVLNSSYELTGNLSVNSSTRIDTNAGKLEALEPNGQPRIVTTSTCQLDVDGNSCQSSLASRETKVTKIRSSSSSEQAASSSTSPETTSTKSDSLASQIKPTKALSREDIRKESSVPILEPSKDPNEESILPEVLTTPSPALNVATATTRIIEEPASPQTSLEPTTQILTTLVAPPSTSTSRTSPDLNSPNQDNTHENASTMKQDNPDQDTKPSGKTENGEQEAKSIAQDQMSLDSIFSDLKDLEADGTSIHGNANHNANVVAQPTASTTPQQKESVFLRLSNRIKALERNMSLSGQYLEELSKRYKKQVEEMQRSLERATSAMGEESRKGEERDLRRIEEITALRDEITSLTESMEILLSDRNSWRSKLSSVCQHFALVVVEIIVFMLVVSYCRRNSEFEDVEEGGVSMENEVERRRSAGAMSTCGGTGGKKSKKRRPSEIASRIGGTYKELMIDERSNHETKKERKKRRKRELNGRTVNGETRKEASLEDNVPGGTALPSRRSSSTEPMSSHAKQLELRNTRRRPDSAPEYSGLWIDRTSIIETSVLDENLEDNDEPMLETKNKRRSLIEEMSALNFSSESPIVENREQEKSTGLSLFRGGGFLKAAKLSSPSFMKTALGSRSKRLGKAAKRDNNPQLRSDNWEWYSRNSSNRSDSGSPSGMPIDHFDSISNGQEDNSATKNGHHRGTSNESESGSSTTTPSTKQEKKVGLGIRKMVRKFF
ncbi:SUN domain-containing ossification factor isoform X2 [Venturia canescens]|uniref:SUN domain-containing ossification factor isoform X2 n=1 Tax=Venturia canescens TaxID=32260 RepID=UPI001C9CDD28|nr:SUN domain-containing ossification factor isoform X2 [Venturia canescens]